MIELLSEEKIRSCDYLRIQSEFRDIWNQMFLNKDRIDRVLFRRLGPFWPFGEAILKSRLRNPSIAIGLIPKMGGAPVTSWGILQENQVVLGRNWEYPWAILNSNISVDTKILDVGSGVSLFPLYLARISRKVDSIDPNEFQMKILAPLLADIVKLKVNFSVGNALNLSAEDNTYDYVFSISVLEHLEQKMENGILINKHAQKLDRIAIREFIRVIKPGGRVILTLDYGNKNLCTDWIQCSFEFEYVKDLIEEFSANLVKPLQNIDDIRLTTEREREVIKLWSEFYPYVPQEKPRFGTGLGIILTKRSI